MKHTYYFEYDYIANNAAHKLSIHLNNHSIESGIESGEHFESIAFYGDTIKMNIGTKGDFGCPEEGNWDYDGTYYALAYNNKGSALDSLAKYEEAIKNYDGAINIRPDYVRAYNNKGGTLYKLGRYKEAINIFDKALNIAPNNRIIYYCKDYVPSKIDKYDKTSNINPNNRIIYYCKDFVPDYSIIYNNKGMALYNLGRYEEAIECFDSGMARLFSTKNIRPQLMLL